MQIEMAVAVDMAELALAEVEAERIDRPGPHRDVLDIDHLVEQGVDSALHGIVDAPQLARPDRLALGCHGRWMMETYLGRT